LAAIPRLRDLGVETFLLAAALRLLAAQRLVRALCRVQGTASRQCAACRRSTTCPERNSSGRSAVPACRGRGYRGRLAIHEVIPAQKFLPLIAANAPLAELAALRDREGLCTLWQHGLAAAGAGLTTVEEVARVL
jgi:type II secretory ATPase GspE/PulE/Tfp pilus assembly ATPase PilB-like protein